tara:strand:- start:380 stop:613 length:234 start_codon:yes stop_codon:yes gene_type:complete
MYGVHIAHKIGDLVRITKSKRDPIISSAMLQRGSLGVVLDVPEDTQKSLFIKVYIFKTNRERWLSPFEMDIISNIDD